MITQTSRLIIREASLLDAPFFLKLLNEPSYIANIRDSGVRDLESAQEFIQNVYLKSYNEHGLGLYVLEHESHSIGVCGFVKRPGLPYVDLGFAILPEYSGKGFIQEASTGLIHYARDVLKLEKLAAITTKENTSSLKVLSKLGFQYLNDMKLPNLEKDFQYFELELR